jgi:hypothetical protein
MTDGLGCLAHKHLGNVACFRHRGSVERKRESARTWFEAWRGQGLVLVGDVLMSYRVVHYLYNLCFVFWLRGGIHGGSGKNMEYCCYMLCWVTRAFTPWTHWTRYGTGVATCFAARRSSASKRHIISDTLMSSRIDNDGDVEVLLARRDVNV